MIARRPPAETIGIPGEIGPAEDARGFIEIAIVQSLVCRLDFTGLDVDFRREQVDKFLGVPVGQSRCAPHDGAITADQKGVRDTIGRKDTQSAHHRIRKTARHNGGLASQPPTFLQGMKMFRIFG